MRTEEEIRKSIKLTKYAERDVVCNSGFGSDLIKEIQRFAEDMKCLVTDTYYEIRTEDNWGHEGIYIYLSTMVAMKTDDEINKEIYREMEKDKAKEESDYLVYKELKKRFENIDE